MITKFRLHTFMCLVAFFPIVTAAALPIVHDPARPYEPLSVDALIEKEQIYLGELAGDPHMFEVTLAEEKVFSMRLLQLDLATTTPFSFILVRDNGNNRGVSEVGRVRGQAVGWSAYRDHVYAMRFKQGLVYSTTVSPGVYRFEVSTPENQGKYLLILGSEPSDSGYFAKAAQIREVLRFFDHSTLRLLLSTHVLYPLGSFFLICLIILTWYRTKYRVGVSS